MKRFVPRGMQNLKKSTGKIPSTKNNQPKTRLNMLKPLAMTARLTNALIRTNGSPVRAIGSRARCNRRMNYLRLVIENPTLTTGDDCRFLLFVALQQRRPRKIELTEFALPIAGYRDTTDSKQMHLAFSRRDLVNP